MKTTSIAIVFFLALTFLTSCDRETIRASDEVTSLDYAIPDYTTLSVSNAFNVFVTFSETEEGIRIEANENLHDRIVLRKDGNSLVIKLRKFTNVRGNATLNAYIVTKDISSFDLNGASSLILENEWVVQKGNLELSGASDFSGEVRAERLHLDLGGASTTTIFGSTTTMYADLSGSSEIADYNLKVSQLYIDLSGASEAFLSVSESIAIEASGASVLNYKGSALITKQDLSGASEIKNRN